MIDLSYFTNFELVQMLKSMKDAGDSKETMKPWIDELKTRKVKS